MYATITPADTVGPDAEGQPRDFTHRTNVLKTRFGVERKAQRIINQFPLGTRCMVEFIDENTGNVLSQEVIVA